MLLVQQLARFDLAEACTTVLATIALTLAVDLASSALRSRLHQRPRPARSR